MAVSFYRLLLTVVIIAISHARPGKLPWRIDPYHSDDVKHNVPEFHEDNGAFFYPDQEFFDNTGFELDHDKKQKADFDNFQDFSGWGELADDEDAAHENRISVISRDPRQHPFHFENGRDVDFGANDVIREVFPSRSQNRESPYIILEEEHFGNELNDIDKVEELTRRMEEMQREMRQMKSLLIKEYSLLRAKK